MKQPGRKGQLPLLKKKASSISVPSIRREPTGSSAGTPNTGFLSPTFSAHRTSTTSLTSVESNSLSQGSASRHKASLSDGAGTSATSLDEPQTYIATIELGGLAKRRGFKGSPLLTSQTSLGGSLRSLSPTTSPGGSRAASLLSPRSSLEAVTNIIRSGKGTSQAKEPDVPPEMQDAYDKADPFAPGETSFYEPSFEFGELPKSTVQDFEVYDQVALAQELSLKKDRLSSLRGAVPSAQKEDATTTTTIYDLTMADIPLKPVPALRVPSPCPSASPSALRQPPRSPTILVTSPSAHSTSARTDNLACSTEMNVISSSKEAMKPLTQSTSGGEVAPLAARTQELAPCLPPTISFNKNEDLLGDVLGNKSVLGDAASVLRDVGNIPPSSQLNSKNIPIGNDLPLSKQCPGK